MKFATIATLFMAASASANPFAPKSVSSTKVSYVNNLMRGATPTANSQLRRLDEEEYEVDISSYSIKFQQCQFVKAYDDEMADNEDAGSPLVTSRFVIFRLCPSSSCGSCNSGFGEYLIDLESYLEAAVGYQEELQEEMCNTCEEYCQNDNDNGRKLNRNLEVDCNSCVDECEKIENMEENGYLEATEYVDCQEIDTDDDSTVLYSGPICSSGGSKIKIGIFTDEFCSNVDSSKSVDDYLGQLSHALLKKTYDADSCISCEVVEEEEEDENEDENDNQDEEEQEPEVTEMCQQLYEGAAKCEKVYGFDDGYSNYAGYENQLSQETVVCDFIKSIKSGTYDESGEIKVRGGSTGSGQSATTGGQKFALTFFIFGTIGLAVYSAMLHNKLTKGSAAKLSNQGGNMA
jgi:hypothetical protein|mmetsp:Transcript_9727/g.10734  ORF Transcript_9727/g.10734 Transcript_9727/m.10734 type:complete len:404 (-) Transcript_9727:143-1354(-)|eukprot:CAMPEP_0195291344 /NCGR_PEP_ID=MMETSP0707-20130614/7734_1 /TAXON_ID=33640 /ORGANISM="Asterionellopsis glacialis, Strain CCMP134" /LENGTH=403 /DNA_ID=CAMNT_0040351649 /DNA_START=29 /DNA_END=1240 /DNA_ORIENTATION=+